MSTNNTRPHISTAVFHAGDAHDMAALSHRNDSRGSVFIGGLQMSGTPDQLRSFAKAIEDGAIEIERQIAEREDPDAA